MRIVYEFHGKDPTGTCGGHYYGLRGDQPPTYRGFQVDLLIVDADQAREGQPFREGDAIHIEGNGDTIKRALQNALRMIDSVERYCKEQAQAEIDRTVQCPACHCWYDSKAEWHADGHGERCPGPTARD